MGNWGEIGPDFGELGVDKPNYIGYNKIIKLTISQQEPTMKNDISKVAQTITKEISKFEAGVPADHGTFHATLGWTKRKSEAHQLAGWFLKKVEKYNPEDKEDFLKLQVRLRDLALAEIGE